MRASQWKTTPRHHQLDSESDDQEEVKPSQGHLLAARNGSRVATTLCDSYLSFGDAHTEVLRAQVGMGVMNACLEGRGAINSGRSGIMWVGSFQN